MASSDVSATSGPRGDAAPVVRPKREVIYRHSVAVRVTHWINVLCLTLLLLSGLQLFNFHPALYWGNYGYRGVPPVLSISGEVDPETRQPVGTTQIGDYSFDTTGILGVTYDSDGRPHGGAFRGVRWTIPNLAPRSQSDGVPSPGDRCGDWACARS